MCNEKIDNVLCLRNLDVVLFVMIGTHNILYTAYHSDSIVCDHFILQADYRISIFRKL